MPQMDELRVCGEIAYMPERVDAQDMSACTCHEWARKNAVEHASDVYGVHSDADALDFSGAWQLGLWMQCSC